MGIPLRFIPAGDGKRSADGKVSAMPQKSAWERFFDAHAPIYEENEFTKNTAREVDFLLEELELPSGAWILDYIHPRGPGPEPGWCP